MKSVSSRKRFNLMMILLIITLALTFLGTGALAVTPKITITSPPVFGIYSTWFNNMSGTTEGIVPSDYWVAPLLYIPGLNSHSKPYGDDFGPYARVIDIYTDSNGTGVWTTPMQTGGIDHLATLAMVYLIPKTSYPACYPLVSGGSIPASLESAAVASDRVLITPQRTINWSGQDWLVKTSIGDNLSGRVGPGRNYFSDSSDIVWIDMSGKLHLRIAKVDGEWTCSEINSLTRLGYGTYKFYVDSRLDNLDKYATLGMFTWSDLAPVAGNREIDLEFTTWGDSILPNNAQYVIQPYGNPGNILRYQMTSAAPSIHSFVWEPGKVSFASTTGTGLPINSWTHTSASVPISADERVHLNLWLNNSSGSYVPGPVSSQPVEMIISKFEFTPWNDPTHPTFGINGRGANDVLTSAVANKYKFKLWGKVTAKDTKGLTLNDGSQTPLTVLDPGHTFEVGDRLTVEGSFSPVIPKQLDTSIGRITPIQ